MKDKNNLHNGKDNFNLKTSSGNSFLFYYSWCNNRVKLKFCISIISSNFIKDRNILTPISASPFAHRECKQVKKLVSACVSISCQRKLVPFMSFVHGQFHPNLQSVTQYARTF